MVDGVALIVRPFLGLPFLIAGIVLWRKVPNRVGPAIIALGGSLSLIAELYAIATMPNTFVASDAPVTHGISPEAWSTAGLVLCAVGSLIHAFKWSK